MKTLLFWSGGLDSTYLLYWHLTKTNDDITAHHIILKNPENRWKAEKRAVDGILPILQTLRPFQYGESTLELSMQVFPGDSTVVGFIGAYVARQLQPDRVSIGRVIEDDERGDSSATDRDAWFRHCLELAKVGNKLPETVLPIRHMNKTQIWNELPQSIRTRTWSCRTPVLDYMACGQCKSCGHRHPVEPVTWGDPWLSIVNTQLQQQRLGEPLWQANAS